VKYLNARAAATAKKYHLHCHFFYLSCRHHVNVVKSFPVFLQALLKIYWLYKLVEETFFCFYSVTKKTMNTISELFLECSLCHNHSVSLWFKVIPLNCITHPSCASFLTWLAHARARAPSEFYRFSMKAELFREINGRFLLNELGDPIF